MKSKLAILVLSIALSGCLMPPKSGRPSQFYRLETPSLAQDVTANPEPTTPSAASILVKVDLNDAITGPRIVLARSDYEVSYADSRRWAEPLDEGMARILASYLSSYYTRVQAAPVPRAFHPDYRVQVRVDKAWATPRGDIILSASWRITDRSHTLVAQGSQEYIEKGWQSGDYREYAQRISRLTVALAQSIKDDLSRLDDTPQDRL